MLILPIEEARPGMALAAAVCNPENPEHELLRRGYLLEDTVIQRMKRMAVTHVFVAYPALDDLDRHLEPFTSPARLKVFSQIKKAFEQSQGRMSPGVSFRSYYDSIKDLVTTLMMQGRNPVFLDQVSRQGTDAVGHAASVAHLSLMLGIKLEPYLLEQRKRLSAQHAKDVVNLGVAAMLHDLGKSQLPPHLRDCNEFSAFQNDLDRAEFQTHSRIGYDTVHDSLEPSGASALLHHHQHFDGSGYPITQQTDGSTRKLAGSSIHIFARILQVADMYDRLSIVPGTSRRRSNLEIMQLIRAKYQNRCDPVVLQALESIAPPYPPGTRLQLSDGTVAVVTDVNPSDPLHPTVKRMGTTFGTLEETPIVLSTPGAPKIKAAA